MLNVTIWNEFIHERENENVKEIYPNGIHTAIDTAGNVDFSYFERIILYIAGNLCFYSANVQMIQIVWYVYFIFSLLKEV
jgi:hypothetical protein